ncbi:hypothetical protein N7527_004319 [Penicillium freii]|nr:hypothetical protein N7527_004319 [Penicillium freii]
MEPHFCSVHGVLSNNANVTNRREDEARRASFTQLSAQPPLPKQLRIQLQFRGLFLGMERQNQIAQSFQEYIFRRSFGRTCYTLLHTAATATAPYLMEMLQTYHLWLILCGGYLTPSLVNEGNTAQPSP